MHLSFIKGDTKLAVSRQSCRIRLLKRLRLPFEFFLAGTGGTALIEINGHGNDDRMHS